jgi:hypothetical protein
MSKLTFVVEIDTEKDMSNPKVIYVGLKGDKRRIDLSKQDETVSFMEKAKIVGDLKKTTKGLKSFSQQSNKLYKDQKDEDENKINRNYIKKIIDIKSNLRNITTGGKNRRRKKKTRKQTRKMLRFL